MFVNRSSLLLDNPIQLSYGIAIVDVDHDGQYEAIVTGFGFPNLALKWNGEHYVDIAPDPLADDRRQSIGVAAADIDGDGQEEIYILNTDTFGGPKRHGDHLYDYDGEEWVDIFDMPFSRGIRNMTAGRSVIAIDRTGSGRYGFYIANYGGNMRLYELDLDGRIIDVAPDVGIDLVTGGRSAIALPLISQRVDIFAANELGPNFLFVNNGNGLFDELSAELGLQDENENGRGVAVLDSNDSGRFDIVAGNWEGPHRLWVQQDDGTFHDEAPPAMAAPSPIRTVIAADFDNDGYEEIFFNNKGAANRLFARRDGAWAAVPIGAAEETLGLGTGAAVADLNGDGRLELLIAHGESGPQPLSLYSTAPNDNNWLRVAPLTRYGAPARGAIVSLQSEGRTQYRVIDGGSGYLCQMEPIAHFGLGAVDTVESMTVTWPDGTRHTIDDPAINQQHGVAFPATV